MKNASPIFTRLGLAALCGLALLLGACATPASYDYSAFRQSRPASILVLPPVNNSTAIEGSYSLLSQVTLPLAESGYYVLPVSLVDETFRQNGLQNPAEMAAVPLPKLRQIFGADAALYITIKQYGTVFQLLNSASVVTAEARLVDLRNGAMLWQGSASASSAENRGSQGNDWASLLVAAVVNQIVESAGDASHKVAGTTSNRLLMAGRPSGLLYGPRSPQYQKQ